MTLLLPFNSVARPAGPYPTTEKYTDSIQDFLSYTGDARRLHSMDTVQQGHIYQKQECLVNVRKYCWPFIINLQAGSDCGLKKLFCFKAVFQSMAGDYRSQSNVDSPPLSSAMLSRQ